MRKCYFFSFSNSVKYDSLSRSFIWAELDLVKYTDNLYSYAVDYVNLISHNGLSHVRRQAII